MPDFDFERFSKWRKKFLELLGNSQPIFCEAFFPEEKVIFEPRKAFASISSFYQSFFFNHEETFVSFSSFSTKCFWIENDKLGIVVARKDEHEEKFSFFLSLYIPKRDLKVIKTQNGFAFGWEGEKHGHYLSFSFVHDANENHIVHVEEAMNASIVVRRLKAQKIKPVQFFSSMKSFTSIFVTRPYFHVHPSLLKEKKYEEEKTIVLWAKEEVGKWLGLI